MPALPDRAAARVGHVRARRQHVRAREPVRGRQRDRGDRGRGRRLCNPRFAREVMRDAYERGVVFTVVSSDLNTANHNFPTNYNHTMLVQGVVADQQGLGQSGAEFPSSPAGDRRRRAGRDLVPQLGHDAVRRPRARRDDGRDRLAGDRPGRGRRGADRVLRRARGLELAPNEMKQLLTHDRRGRGGGEHGRRRHARPRAARLGPALRLRAARPRARARAHRARADPAAGADRLAGLVRAVPAGARATASRSAAALSARTGPFTSSCSGRRASSRPRASSRRSAGRSRRAARSTARSARSTSPRVRARARRAARRRRRRRPDRAGQGPGRRRPQRVRVHRPREGHRRPRQPRRGPQDAVRYRDRTLHAGWPHRRRRRERAAAGRRRRRQPARRGGRRLERRAARARPRRRAARAFNGGRRSAPNRSPRRPDAPGFDRVDAPREPLRTPAIGDLDGDGEAEIVTTRASTSSPGRSTAARSGLPGARRPGPLAPAGPHERQPRQERLHRVAGAGRPARRRRARDRRRLARPARLRVERRRHGAAGLPGRSCATRPLAGRRDHHDADGRRPHGDGRPEIVTPTEEYDAQPGRAGRARRARPTSRGCCRAG